MKFMFKRRSVSLLFCRTVYFRNVNSAKLHGVIAEHMRYHTDCSVSPIIRFMDFVFLLVLKYECVSEAESVAIFK